MLNIASKTPVPPAQHSLRLDPRIRSLHKNLERIASVAKLFHTLTPADFSPTEDDVWNHMGRVLASAVFNIKQITDQLETQALISTRR